MISVRPTILPVHIFPVVIGLGSHVYWRMVITSTVGTTFVAMDELEFLDATGTKLTVGGTATASSFFSNDPTYAPSKAFNGVATDFWHSNAFPSAGSPQWIKYQFTGIVNIAAVRIIYRTSNLNQAPKDWSIEYSDNDSTWTSVITYSLNWSTIGVGRCLTFPLIAPPAGYYCNWRLKVNTNAASAAPSGAEFEMHETVGGPDITNNTVWEYTMWTDAFATGYSGYYIFDDNTSTMWAASNPPPGNFIGQALNRAIKVVEIKWMARNDISYAQSPLSFTMQATNNGVTWVDITTTTFSAWTAPGQIKTIAI